jgi:hypothetical protein
MGFASLSLVRTETHSLGVTEAENVEFILQKKIRKIDLENTLSLCLWQTLKEKLKGQSQKRKSTRQVKTIPQGPSASPGHRGPMRVLLNKSCGFTD